MPAEPIHVTDAAFEKTVLQSEIPVVIDFWAPWCGPCKVQGPILEAVAKEQPKLSFFKVNVDKEPQLASDNDVRGIPTLIFVKEGKIVDKHSGVLDKAELLRKIQDHY